MTPAEPIAGPGGDYGEVFTRRWVVELILDLVQYVPERDLGSLTLVEPSCGTGAFLVPITERLIASAQLHGRDLTTLKGAIRAFDLLEANAERSRKAVANCLADAGMTLAAAEDIASAWIVTDDFLLQRDSALRADIVVGNPPYIRLESVPERTMDAYRKRCATMRGRADIYVGFIERGLELLRTGGSLGFIVADRWMHNQYGAHLRRLISGSYAVDTVVTMHDVDAFEEDVSAYPAVVVLRAGEQSGAVVVDATRRFDKASSGRLSNWVTKPASSRATGPGFKASRLKGWFPGDQLWPVGSPEQLEVVKELESRFPPLEDPRTGTRVGIGLATGCDEVYITNDPELVEEDRLLPLLQAADIADGESVWSGSFLVNPWDNQGLVDLSQRARLRRYLESHGERLRARHVARRRPSQWYRTIDRVDPSMLSRPKLLLPDIKSAAHPVLDRGTSYPHHNLYHVVSEAWDLEVLGGLLLSDVTNLLVGSYCVKMRGGCYRFQAQYLRRIRVPELSSVRPADARALTLAFRARDVAAATAVAVRVYGLGELPRTV
ncbi:MAG: Eco57I restriction-modification methylase domain-containing protein [Acidimicrobiales bacterium]